MSCRSSRIATSEQLWPPRGGPHCGAGFADGGSADRQRVVRPQLRHIGPERAGLSRHQPRHSRALRPAGVRRHATDSRLTAGPALRHRAQSTRPGVRDGPSLVAVHPLNSEVVEYVTQRTESMMALCYLATLYAGNRAHGSKRPSRWYTAAVAACALGMACKESMVTAPLVVILYDRVYVSSRSGRLSGSGGVSTAPWRRPGPCSRS